MKYKKYKYIPHDRHVPQEDIDKYKDLALNDIEVEGLLLLEGSEVLNKSGEKIIISKELLYSIRDSTKDWVRKQIKNPFRKIRSYLPFSDIENELIPLHVDHDESIKGRVGNSKGLPTVKKTEDGLHYLSIPLVLKDLYIKDKIFGSGGLEDPNISIHTREDNSIREISIVSLPGHAGSGLVLNEGTCVSLASYDSNKELLLKEQTEIKDKISKHIIVSSMIKTGQVLPHKYEELMLSDINTLNIIRENVSPRNYIGVTYGANNRPSRIAKSDIEVAQDYLVSKGYKLKEEDVIKHKVGDQLTQFNISEILQLYEIDPYLVGDYLKSMIPIEVKKPKPDLILKELQDSYARTSMKLAEANS